MEGKKLNLNQPFLSVRRPHSQAAAGGERSRRHVIPPIPYYNSELKSGPVGKNGAVPFHWEQTPGKPREGITTSIENKAQDDVDDLHSTAAPKLPPGRYLNPILKDFHQVSSNRFAIIEGLNVDNFECLEEKTAEKKSTSATEEHSNNNNNSVDDDDDDEEYVDAVDTLSRSNSTFLNCSMSGVSGLEDLDVKPCRDFTRDPNTLNIVMDRFLPAAKAMVSDKPQYVSKKPIVIRGEQLKDVVVKKMVVQKEDKDKPLLRYGPSYANRYSHHHVSEEREEDEDIEYDDDDDHGHGTLIPSVCGLFPRFCLKGSSGILNPVPGMSFRTQVAKSHGHKVRNRSFSNFPNPEIRDLFNEVCDIKRADKIGTVVIEENESITGLKSRKKVSKTFAQLLNDKDGPEDSDSGFNGAAERVISFDTMHTVEYQSVPNEVLRSTDKEDRDRDEHVDSPSTDLKISHSVDLNNNSTATDDTKIAMKKTEIRGKKYAEFVISPPLPKSPSDSWLWRTLPSVSAKNVHRHSNLGTEANTRDLNSKIPVSVTRWEAIVKSSKMQHDNSHYPEEILTPLQKT